MAQSKIVSLYGLSTDATDDPKIQLIEETSEGLIKGISKYTIEGKIPVYVFNVIFKNYDPEYPPVVVLVSMNLPSFFNEMNGNKIQGLFLVGLKGLSSKKGPSKKFFMDFLNDNFKNGNMGCPIPIKIGDLSSKLSSSKDDHCNMNRFTFNDMSFNPFLMTNMTIGYFVSDKGGPNDWKDDDDHTLIGLDYPLQYDATLGLFITRAAHLCGPKKKPMKPKKKDER